MAHCHLLSELPGKTLVSVGLEQSEHNANALVLLGAASLATVAAVAWSDQSIMHQNCPRRVSYG